MARLEDRKGRITGTEVRMRSDPNQNGDVLDYFTKGEIVTILDAADGGGLHWTKVQRETETSAGWLLPTVRNCKILANSLGM